MAWLAFWLLVTNNSNRGIIFFSIAPISAVDVCDLIS